MRFRLALLALLPACVAAGEPATPAVTAAELATVLGTRTAPLVVDVRSFPEYKSGHVRGAENIPYERLGEALSRLRGVTNGVVLYCMFGERTRLAEELLLGAGLPNLSHLAGGLAAWRQGGHPIHVGWGP